MTKLQLPLTVPSVAPAGPVSSRLSRPPLLLPSWVCQTICSARDALVPSSYLFKCLQPHLLRVTFQPFQFLVTHLKHKSEPSRT